MSPVFVSSRLLITCTNSTSKIDGRHFVILNFPKVSSLRKLYIFLLEILRSCFSLPPLKIKFKSSHLREEQVKCSRNKTNPQRATAMTVVIESHDV